MAEDAAPAASFESFAPPDHPHQLIESPDEPPIFFPVSPGKLIIMSIASFGLYEFYWSYRNWTYIRGSDGSRILPFWRAWFALFFHYSLIARIKADTSARAVVHYPPAVLTIGYLLLLLTSRLPGAFSYIAYLSFLPLLPVVRAINEANEGRVGSEQMNTRFTAWNLALIALAVVLFGLDLLFWVRPDLVPS